VRSSCAQILSLAAFATSVAAGCGSGAGHGNADAADNPAADAHAGDARAVDSAAGGDAGTVLPACTTTIVSAFEVDSIDPPASGSDAYQQADAATRAAVAASMRALFAGDEQTALARAADADYELCRGQGDEEGVVLWRPETTGTGRALVAWRTQGARPLIIGAPHAYHDSTTLEEGATLFFELGARALVASGTHRCASATATTCDGTSTVCGGTSAPYRISDMAHTVDSVFQVAHEVLADELADDWVLSLHGMADDGVSLSDGTTLASSAGMPVALLGAALMAEFPAEAITSCNTWPGAVVEERLCGTNNVQGRLVNGSPEPCGQAASTSAGRFLHMEQSTAVRAARDKVLQALADALP